MTTNYCLLDTDKHLKSYNNKDLLLDEQEHLVNKLKRTDCYAPSIIFQPVCAINPVHDNDRSNLVDIATLTKFIDKTLKGKYLLCRIISLPAEIWSDVFVIVDDPEGNLAVRLLIESFYQELLPVGTIMVIKDPLFELSEKGGYVLRCKSTPTGNVTFLNEYQCQQFFPDITWKGEIPKEHRVLVVDEKPKPKTAEGWKVLGNKYFTQKNYYSSINAYTSGIKVADENVLLLSNRSAAYMQISAYNLALNDVNKVLNIDAEHVKSIYRKGKALCGLKRYEEALEILIKMESLDLQESDRKDVRKLKSKIHLFLHQQKTGDYDVAFMLKTVKANKSCNFDYADYTGPVEIRCVPGKGRGLFVTQDVKPGQLIIGCKAFGLFPPDSVVCKELSSPQVTIGGVKSMELNIVRMLMTNPEIGKELYQLYAGPELKFLDRDQLGENTGFVDRNRIENIFAFNAFSGINFFQCQLDSFGTQGTSSGLWLLPSYINHSCFDYNCNWIIFGDFILIRAFNSIAKDEEVLISYIRPDEYSARMTLFEKHGFSCDCRLCEMDQRDSKEVHEKRRHIIEECKRLDMCSSSIVFQHLSDQIASLRSKNSELNIYMARPMVLLDRSLRNEGQYTRSATVKETLFNIFKHPVTYHDDILLIAGYLALYYLNIKCMDMAKKWFETLKECALLVYGTNSVDMLKAVGLPEILQDLETLLKHSA